MEIVKWLIYLSFYAHHNRLGVVRPLFRLILYPLRGHSIFAFRPIAPMRLYEFGAATGNDLALYKEAGWEVNGCEPSARACAIAAERGIQLENHCAESIDIEPDSYSAILLNNVLEHTHDPAAVLATALRGLVAGGSLIVIVPNHSGVSARLFSGSWPGYDAPRHLWGFTPASLRAILQKIGFGPARIYHRFQGPWAWQAALDGRHGGTPVAGWRRCWDKLASFALYPLGIVAASLGYGDFMTVVATKPHADAAMVSGHCP
jgi:SAM-dependent methyltransferase